MKPRPRLGLLLAVLAGASGLVLFSEPPQSGNGLGAARTDCQDHRGR